MDSIPNLSMDTWSFVGLMGAFAFIAAMLGSLIAFPNRFVGAIIAGVLFAAVFVAWNYMAVPHFGLPFAKSMEISKSD